MRPELELLAKIDAYIDNKLTTEEKAQFEDELNQNDELREAVQQQIELREGIQYLSLKFKVNAAYKSYRIRKQLKKWGIIGLLGAAIISSYFVINSLKESEQFPAFSEPTIPIINSEKEFEVGSLLPIQKFELKAKEDNVIETTHGTVISIPANSFHTKSEKVVLEIKEALTPEDIIKNGLSTFSNHEELISAGMFEIIAKDENGIVKIRKGGGLLVDVPTNYRIPKMKIYDGKKNKNGDINWINPKPLETFLKTVDINSLNFYPPGFEDKLIELGYTNKPKVFKDSLFYSFFCQEPAEKEVWEAEEEEYISERWGDTIPLDNITLNYPSNSLSVQSEAAPVEQVTDSDSFLPPTCGIEPSQIKAIWNKKFQNTLIATKEFEERLVEIYRSCDPNILELYLKGMSSPLYELDQQAAQRTSGQSKRVFEQFAKDKMGRVNSGNQSIKLLIEYYEKKRKLYKLATQKAFNDYWSKEFEKDQEVEIAKFKKSFEEYNRQTNNFKKELEFNLKTMYEEAGIPYPVRATINKKSFDSGNLKSYSFTVSNLGWKNIDMLANEATRNRESVSFTNEANGKTVGLTFSPFNFKISNEEQYDKTMVYLTSIIHNSFLKLKKDSIDNTFIYRLNDNMIYNMVAVGYKESKLYMGTIQDIHAGNYELDLNEVSQSNFRDSLQHLCAYRFEGRDIEKDILFQQYLIKNEKRKRKNVKLKENRKSLRPVIFPCQSEVNIVRTNMTYDKVWHNFSKYHTK